MHDLLAYAFQILDTFTAFYPFGKDVTKSMKVDERIIHMVCFVRR